MEQIKRNIAILLAQEMGRATIPTWDEVEEAYASGKYPAFNEAVDYIIGG